MCKSSQVHFARSTYRNRTKAAYQERLHDDIRGTEPSWNQQTKVLGRRRNKYEAAAILYNLGTTAWLWWSSCTGYILPLAVIKLVRCYYRFIEVVGQNICGNNRQFRENSYLSIFSEIYLKRLKLRINKKRWCVSTWAPAVIIHMKVLK